MKNIIIILAILISPAFIFAQNLTNNFPAKTEILLISSNEKETIIKFKIGGIKESLVSYNNIDYNKFSLDKGVLILKKGFPEFQKLVTSIIIPDLAETKIEVISSNYIEYNNIKILPSKGTLSRSIDPSTIPYIFGGIYNRDEYYPSDIAELGEPYIIRDFRGQTVIVHPFRFNAVQNKLKIYTEITVKISAIGNNGANPLVRKVTPKNYQEDFKQIYERRFLNFKSNTKYTPIGEAGNMLIICYGQYMNAMQPFIDWKIQKGISAAIVDVATIGGATAIKTFVENYYAANGLAFLLLVGDDAQVPTYPASIGSSDNTYSYIVGNDHYPDIFVGRFSAEDTIQVITQATRTVNYEKTPDPYGQWYKNAIGIASDQGPGDDNEIDYQHIRNIRTNLLNYTYSNVAELYDGTEGGLDATGSPVEADVLNILNGAGCSLINYTGHGGSTGWGTSGFGNSYVDSITNNKSFPFIFSVACSVGDFTTTTCFAEKWLRATSSSQPVGAIAVAMSTISQYWNEPMCGQDEMDSIMLELYPANIKHTFGGVTMNGCMKMNDDYGQGGYDMTDTWNVFGDPSVVLRTDIPTSMTVSHATAISIGSTNLVVNCNINGALACLTLNGNILGTGYISGGTTNITFTALSVLDTITVTVTDYNKIPYIGYVTIIQPSGPYVVYNSLTINDVAGNNNQLADYNEQVQLNVTLANVGPVTANNVNAVLSTNDPYITITDSIQAYGNITNGTNSLQNNAFAITIDDSLPDLHVASFNIKVTDANSNTWISGFQITINAPVLCIGNLTIDDVTGGNGNGILEAGETANITILSSNLGHADCIGVSGNLSTTNPDIIINTPVSNITQINQGATVNATYNISVSSSAQNGDIADFTEVLTSMQYIQQDTFYKIIGIVNEDWETATFTKFSWAQGGNQPWVIVSDTVYEGQYSAKSGTITDSQTSELSISMQVIINDSISFYRRVSSEHYYDFLYFYIDNVLKGSWSGIEPWARSAYPVTTGYRTFKWVFSKDYIDTDPLGSDCSWIDYIVFPPSTGLVSDIKNNLSEESHFSCFPNPANSVVNISYYLEDNKDISISIFNIYGEKIATVLENSKQNKGEHSFKYNVDKMPKGMYFIEFITNNEKTVKKIIVN